MYNSVYPTVSVRFCYLINFRSLLWLSDDSWILTVIERADNAIIFKISLFAIASESVISFNSMQACNLVLSANGNYDDNSNMN